MQGDQCFHSALVLFLFVLVFQGGLGLSTVFHGAGLELFWSLGRCCGDCLGLRRDSLDEL